LPQLTRSHGAVVNNLSLASLAPLPVVAAYSISKAAAAKMTQSLRALVAGQSVAVHGVFLGPIDTDMNRGFEIPLKQNKTEVRFTHAGLAPQFECYGSCSSAWSTLINGNLRKLVTTGKNQPDAFA
jgi:short-subunit dehydrogenase